MYVPVVIYCIYFSQEGCVYDMMHLRIGCGGQTGPSSVADSASTDDATGNICHRGTRFSSKEKCNVCEEILTLMFVNFKGKQRTSLTKHLNSSPKVFLTPQLNFSLFPVISPDHIYYCCTWPCSTKYFSNNFSFLRWAWRNASQKGAEMSLWLNIQTSESTFYSIFPHINSLGMPKKLPLFKEIQQNHNLDISLAEPFLSLPQKWFVQLFQYVGHYG